mgnify:CR=1 FL=1
MHCVALLHGPQPDISRSWQDTLATLRLPLDGFLGFFRLFLGLLGRFVGRSLGLGRLRREPVGLVGFLSFCLGLLLQQTFRLGLLGSDPISFLLLFGLGVGFLLCQALRLGLCGNQMSDAPCSCVCSTAFRLTKT